MDVTQGRLIRVQYVDQDTGRVYIEFEAGLDGHFDPADDLTFKPGDIFFLSESGRLDRAPDDLWPRPVAQDIGIVKLVTFDTVVAEVNGKLRLYRLSQLAGAAVGQTVEVLPDGNLGRVLSDKPIDRISLATDDFDIQSLIIKAEDNSTTLEDFGGYARMVKRARDLVSIALAPDEPLKAIGVNPIKGILFSGPSGAGKTFLAKAVAGSFDASFYNIGGPVIVDQFVGQSEKRLREIFEHASTHAPAILFFDEIDSLYTQRGASNHESTNRLVGQFLSLLDSFVRLDKVLIIATTNLPGVLDGALLRPGRLGHKLEFHLPNVDNRKSILRTASGKIDFAEDVDIDELSFMTDNWTAADLAAIWTEAGILAVLDGRRSLCREDVFEAVSRVQRVSKQVATDEDFQA